MWANQNFQIHLQLLRQKRNYPQIDFDFRYKDFLDQTLQMLELEYF